MIPAAREADGLVNPASRGTRRARPAVLPPPHRRAPDGWVLSGGAALAARFSPMIVVYDGQCRVCSRLARGLTRFDRDGALRVVSASHPVVADHLGWIPAQALDEGLQVVAGDGRNWQGAAAVEAVLACLGTVQRSAYWATLLLRLPGARSLLRWGYTRFARHRRRFGCCDDGRCSIPAPGQDGASSGAS